MSRGTALRCAGAIVLVSVIVTQADIGAIAAALAAVDPLPAVGGCLLLFAGQVASAQRWRLVCARRGIEAGPAWFTVAYLRGCFYSTLLPTGYGGDVARAHLTRQPAGAGAAARAVLEDRLLGLAALAVAAGLALPFAGYPLPRGAALTAAAVGALAVAFGAARLGRGLTAWSVIQLAFWVAGVWMLGAALGVSVSAAALPAVLLVVGVAMALPITVGATGTREAGFVAALAPLGIPTTAAVTLGIAFGAGVAVVALAGAPLPGRLRSLETTS